MKIFLTGATGFLGYNIATACAGLGHQLLCLRRRSSVSRFPQSVERRLQWVTEDEAGWLDAIKSFGPELLIHAAWGGVDAAGRNNAEVQQANVKMTQRIMTAVPFKQIVMLGSQDEYGQINAKTDESAPLRPLSEYAKAKIRCCQLLQQHCGDQTEWQWIRIFSVYGQQQRPMWLIPSVIGKCLRNEPYMETTRGEQVYSYLYSADFARAIASIAGQRGKSGIYNLSSAKAIRLCDLFDLIKRLTGSSIEFRKTLPYRENQSMVILGDASKFIRAFGPFEQTTLEEGLRLTIEQLRNNHPETTHI
jgi:UDP-glucose 4-epimerase